MGREGRGGDEREGMKIRKYTCGEILATRMYKIGKHFGISGKLFLHIQSFLTDRYARLKITNTEGDWIQSLFGTSAGTLLGPLLFIYGRPME